MTISAIYLKSEMWALNILPEVFFLCLVFLFYVKQKHRVTVDAFSCISDCTFHKIKTSTSIKNLN